MRTFKCYDCGHSWPLPFGTGGRGCDLSCPQCGSRQVHRAEQARGCGGGWRHGQLAQSGETHGFGRQCGQWAQHEV